MDSPADFPEPRPKQRPDSRFDSWISTIPLILMPCPELPDLVNIFDVVERRVSRRSFGVLPVEKLSCLLWYTAKTVTVRKRSPEPDWERRRLPSAGGCHAVHLLVVPSVGDVGIYDARAHGLRVLAATRAVMDGNGVLPEEFSKEKGTLIFAFGDPSRIEGYYEDWASLMWRDAGVLIGGLALIAEALECSFCPIGILATNLVRSVTGNERVIGLGACMVGEFPAQK